MEDWMQHVKDATKKQQITLRLDDDVIDFFRKGGKMYQTRINSVLRAYVLAQKQAQKNQQK